MVEMRPRPVNIMFGDKTLVPLFDEILKNCQNRPFSSKSEIDLIDQKPSKPDRTRQNPSKPDRDRQKPSKIGDTQVQQISKLRARKRERGGGERERERREREERICRDEFFQG